ncbi:hypothetical protein JTE90_010949 [Oedothorax gibbosus]|uniref:Thyroglobulin type-1 domain-containing protein n=1 Tax=Oedothorax gibbosus TaxID=931172 RepID=A0AAV6U9Z9_9ARAC|nr:hypothetical protein JTE90_010949 [Oedothorax gibbosus]
MKTLIFVVIVAVVFGAALTNGETACQNQKRNNSGNGPLQWDIECDAQGNYLPKQCTRQTPKWCACYNSEGLVTQPSRAIKSCECLLAKHQLEVEGKRGCDLPTCQRSGKYEKKQCCAKTGLCHCVNETTGEKTNQPSNNRNLQCP